MWFIMFLILISGLDDKIIFACFICCCLTQAYINNLDHKRQSVLDAIIARASETNDKLIQRLQKEEVKNENFTKN